MSMLSMNSHTLATDAMAMHALKGPSSSLEAVGTLNRPVKPVSSTRDSETEKVAKDFEGVFASMLLKETRGTLEEGTLFGEDSGDVYGGLFDLYLGKQMSDSGGFGLARMVRESLQREKGWSNSKSEITEDVGPRNVWNG